jgi:hypothetical protein
LMNFMLYSTAQCMLIYGRDYYPSLNVNCVTRAMLKLNIIVCLFIIILWTVTLPARNFSKKVDTLILTHTYYILNYLLKCIVNIQSDF